MANLSSLAALLRADPTRDPAAAMPAAVLHSARDQAAAELDWLRQAAARELAPPSWQH